MVWTASPDTTLFHFILLYTSLKVNIDKTVTMISIGLLSYVDSLLLVTTPLPLVSYEEKSSNFLRMFATLSGQEPQMAYRWIRSNAFRSAVPKKTEFLGKSSINIDILPDFSDPSRQPDSLQTVGQHRLSTLPPFTHTQSRPRAPNASVT